METQASKKGLLHNLMQATLSNIKNSLYIIDESQCENRHIRNIIINYNIE
jgi:hypothetical protein